MEIKFKVYSRLTKQMYWYKLMWGNKLNIGSGYLAVMPFGEEPKGHLTMGDNRTGVDPADCEIMQCSGVQDMNGNDIYDNDILIDREGKDGDMYRVWQEEGKWLIGGMNKEWDEYLTAKDYSVLEVVDNYVTAVGGKEKINS